MYICILLPIFRNLSYEFHIQVIITNLEAGLVMDLDAKKWPEAPADDTSSFYKVGDTFCTNNYELLMDVVYFSLHLENHFNDIGPLISILVSVNFAGPLF